MAEDKKKGEEPGDNKKDTKKPVDENKEHTKDSRKEENTQISAKDKDPIEATEQNFSDVEENKNPEDSGSVGIQNNMVTKHIDGDDSEMGSLEEGDVVQILSEPEASIEMVAVKANEIIDDIMAEEKKVEPTATVQPIAGEKRKFKTNTMIRKVPFSIGNIDVYLHLRYAHVNVVIRCLVECFIVVTIFMFLPILLVILKPSTSLREAASHVFKTKATDLVYTFMSENFFVSTTYVIFVLFSLAFDNVLYIAAFFLRTLGISIQGSIAEVLQILRASRRHLRDMMVSFTVFLLAINVLSDYKFFSAKKDIMFLLLTFIFWFGCVSGILFIQSFITNFFTSELRRKSFRGRIWDTNYKTFVFKKLGAVAEATPHGRHAVSEAIRTTSNDFDSGFFLKHNDLDLSSQNAAKNLAESIFGYLDIDELEYETIEKFFPDNPKDVYGYLRGNKPSKDEKNYEYTPIEYEVIKTRCIELYQERVDISRSLYDRDNILRKLEFVLYGVVAFFALIMFLMLLNVNYQIYIASVGPFIFGFGWIFQDSIKEIYRCFVFHLINHPFDCGDRVVIDNEELTVLRIDLMYTTYINLNGRLQYIPNASMFLKKVENIRRSDLQSEDVILMVAKDTKFEQILALRDEMSKFLNLNTKDFSGGIVIKNYAMDVNFMQVILSIEHNSNFQEKQGQYIRRENFLKELERLMEECNITFDHCFRVSG